MRSDPGFSFVKARMSGWWRGHVLANGCDNARTIARTVLEARVLSGLRERMMTPDMAAEALRSYAQETNRLNRERRQTEDATHRDLAETTKAVAEIVRVIEQGGYQRALSTRLAGWRRNRTASPHACPTRQTTPPTFIPTSPKPTGAGSSA
jgi:hypothetical protein